MIFFGSFIILDILAQNMRPTTLIGMAALSGGLVMGTYLYLARSPVISSSASPPSVSETSDSRPPTENLERFIYQPPENSLLSPEPPPPETKRDYLRRYHGAGFSEIEKQLEAEGYNLDALVAEGDIAPWEEVEDRIHKMFVGSLDQILMVSKGSIRWPEEINQKYILDHFKIDSEKLTDADVSMVESIAQDYNKSIQEDAKAMQMNVHDALEAVWVERRYDRAPLLLHSAPPDHNRPFVAGTSVAGYGWCVAAAMYRDEYPELNELQKRIDKSLSERNAAIQKYLNSLR